MKEKFIKYWNSITVKSISLLIFVIVAVLICMETASFYFMSKYEESIIRNYQDSLELYIDFWDNSFQSMNNELLSVIATSNTDHSYHNVCKSEDELRFQTSLSSLNRRLTQIAWNHGNDMLVFVYVPDKDVYIKSSNGIVPNEERKQLDNDIRSYIRTAEKKNEDNWEYLKSGDTDYFIQVYQLYNGYIGCIITWEELFEGLLQDGQIMDIVMLNDEYDLVNHYTKDDQTGLLAETEEFDISMKCLPYTIRIAITQKSLMHDKVYFVVLSVLTIIIGIGLLVFNICFHMKYLLGPLNCLKTAMEQFSQGDFGVRLKENQTSNEVNILFRTFNEMAEQIIHLQAEVLNKELSEERMKSNYLRIQIQPHFYTNILNLIYGMAQLRDYQSIQKLSMTTGKYFRYLLGEKGSLVKLKEEIDCVCNYFEIQKIRYGDNLEFYMNVEEDMREQMIMPLIMQTFVGNSIKHNVNLVDILKVKVDIRKQEEKIHIVINDNGVGFPDAVLDRINRGENISEDGEHIGICNVKERLKLLYSDKGCVHISSRPGESVVTVILPVII